MMLCLLSCTFFFLVLAHLTTPLGLAAASRTGTADVSLECGLHAPLRKLEGSSITVDEDSNGHCFCHRSYDRDTM